MMSDQQPETRREKRAEYWLKNKLLIGGLLLIWGVLSFVFCVFLAEPLTGITLVEIPVSFWLAQQGTMVVFVMLIFVYAWVMDRLDDQYDVREVQFRDDDEDTPGERGEEE